VETLPLGLSFPKASLVAINLVSGEGTPAGYQSTKKKTWSSSAVSINRRLAETTSIRGRKHSRMSNADDAASVNGR
jgi:hypothetical protein